MSDLVERLRAIGEEEMYQAPATTKATIDKAAEELERLYARVAELESVISGEIEITPEMIEAGRKAYCGPFEGPERYRQADIALVSAIYLAMRAALTNSGAPNDEG